MIVVHIDTTTDAHTLVDCYKDAKDTDIILVNPTKAEVIKVLTEHPNETLMGLGHGSGSGLFGCGGVGNYGYVIDKTMLDLLKDREMIGIWCHAKDFGRANGLKGFFTSMFVSNPSEASWYNFKKVSEEVTQEQNTIFSKKVNDLIKYGVPLTDWIDNLQDYDHTLDFVRFNYENFEYFDGTQKPYTPTYEKYDFLNEDFGDDDDTLSAKTRGDYYGTLFDSVDYYGYDNDKYSMYDDVDTIDIASGDIDKCLEKFRMRMEYDDELAVGCTTITKEQLENWQKVIDEMKHFCAIA